MTIFGDKGDYEAFERVLLEAVEWTGTLGGPGCLLLAISGSTGGILPDVEMIRSAAWSRWRQFQRCRHEAIQMSISAIVETPGGDKVIFGVVGNTELVDTWQPIIRWLELHYLDYIVTAGLSIDRENYADVMSEVSKLLLELMEAFPYKDDVVNPVFRCKRLLHLLEANPPDSGAHVYIG